MKKTIILITMLSLAATAYAQKADTIRVNYPKEVEVIRTDSLQVINISGSADDPDFKYSSSISISPDTKVSVVQHKLDLFDLDIFNASKRYERSNSGKMLRSEVPDYVEIGFYDGMNEGDGVSINPRFLSELTFRMVSASFYPFRKGLSLSAGLDLGYKSVRISGDNKFTKDGDNVILTPFDSRYTRQMSAIRYNYVGVPVLLSYDAKSVFRIFAGAGIDYNFNGRIRDKYRLDGQKIKDKTSNVQLERLTWYYTAGMAFEGFGVYCKYSPCNVLAGGTGPEFQTWSVGLYIRVE